MFKWKNVTPGTDVTHLASEKASHSFVVVGTIETHCVSCVRDFSCSLCRYSADTVEIDIIVSLVTVGLLFYEW